MKILKRMLHKHFTSLVKSAALSPLPLDPNRRNLVVLPRRARILSCLFNAICAELHDTYAPHVSSEHESGPGDIIWVGFDETDELNKIVPSLGEYQVFILAIFRDRGPFRRHPRFLMTWLQILYLLATPFFRLRRPVLVLSKPVPLSEKVTSNERLRVRLRREYERILKAVRGVPLEPLERQFQNAFGSKDAIEAIQQIADETDTSAEVVRRKARREFMRTAANPHFAAYIPAAFLCKLLFRRLFSRVAVSGVESLREASLRSTPVIVPLHRSHFDYLLVGVTVYEANLSCPLIAAGINLNFWPFGPSARRLGAFFVRRGVREQQLLRLVLKQYVSYLVRRGHSIEFFIEGGRSRSGKMRAPKLGILSDIVESYLASSPREVEIIPTSITYERVVEDRSLARENTGEGKQKENLRNLIKARSTLRSRYGEVHVHYGKPIALGEFLKQRSVPVDRDDTLQQLGRDITIEIRNASMLSLSSLQCTALMAAPRYGLPRSALFESVTNLYSMAEHVQGTIGGFIGPTKSLKRYLDSKGQVSSEEGAHAVVAQRAETNHEDFFYIPGKTRYLADFYKNGSLHLFAQVNMLALSELLNDKIDLDLVSELFQLLQHELQFPEETIFIEQINRLIESLLKAEILSKKRRQLWFSERKPGVFCPQVLLPTLESFEICLSQLEQGADSKAEITLRDFKNEINQTTKTRKYLSLTARTEAASESNVQSALRSLVAIGAVSREFDQSGRTILRRSEKFDYFNTLVKRARKECGMWLASLE